MKKSILIILMLFPVLCKAERLSVGVFGGHSDNASLEQRDYVSQGDGDAIMSSEIDVLDSGNGIQTRSAYYQFSTIGVATHTTRGGYIFFNASGVRSVVFTNDKSAYVSTDFFSGSLPTWTAFITTDTVNTHYKFIDSNGVLYRATSNNNQLASYNGSATTYYPSAPTGNSLAILPDRLVVSGVVGSTGTVYFSGAADFSNFTTGLLETDPFTETFGDSGDSVVDIESACGGLLVMTKRSTFLWTGTGQYDGNIEKVINIGTEQPYTVAKDKNGILYFQGNDLHVYRYDCNTVEKISGKLYTPWLGTPANASYRYGWFDSRDRYNLSVPDSTVGSGVTLVFNPLHGSWSNYRYSTTGHGISGSYNNTQTVDYIVKSTGVVYQKLQYGITYGDGANLSGVGGTATAVRWFSKFFTLGDPFVEKEIRSISVYGFNDGSFTTKFYKNGNVSSGTAITCAIDDGSSVYLNTCTQRFPVGTVVDNMAIEFTSAINTPFTIYGFSIEYTPKPWRVMQ